MSKFKFVAGVAGAVALSVGAFSAVPSAEAGREFKKSIVQFDDRGATAEEKRAKRAKRRANRAKRRANRAERRANRAESRSERRAERRAKRKDRKVRRRDRVKRAERRERRAERRARRADRRADRRERRARRYERRKHGKRFRNRRHSHKHYYNGFYYASPWWLYSAPIIAYSGARYAGSDYELHVEWCEDRYRSYNERRDAYMGYDGYWHACISPYS
ncbi:BA14K family protein [Anderseniella sp. Alg231-50]|uniref:BA14K family protein n=1 Tax=Anderseniella sp. Alg231-50 TaxID=1922226 RepID=UPI000D554D98